LDISHEERGLIPELISGRDVSLLKPYTLPAMKK
jgi:hypothetical protein